LIDIPGWQQHKDGIETVNGQVILGREMGNMKDLYSDVWYEWRAHRLGRSSSCWWNVVCVMLITPHESIDIPGYEGYKDEIDSL